MAAAPGGPNPKEPRMCHTTIHLDRDNTVPVTSTAAITGAVGTMVRKHALIRNESVEPEGTVTFNAGRNLSFMARLNHEGTYDVDAFTPAMEPAGHMCGLSKDGLGLAIITLCDRA